MVREGLLVLLLLMNFVYFIWTSALLLVFILVLFVFYRFSIFFSSLISRSFSISSSLLFSYSLSHFHFLHFYFSHCGSFQATGGPIFRMRIASPANVPLLIVIIFGLSRHVLDIVLSPLWAKADIIM
jgi:hypothetical protein